MPSLPVYDISKKKVGSVDLNDAVFAAEVRPHLLNDAVRAQVAWKHEWKTANSRTRTEVKGTRKKVYRQKGTGQARHGDLKAPIFVGGGKAHGPKPRRVVHKINKKVMKSALVSALSMNQKQDRLFVIDKLELSKVNAKAVSQLKKSFNFPSVLVINSEDTAGEKAFNRSSKNVARIKTLKPEGINVFDILKYRYVVLSQKAAQKITERLANV